MYINEINVSYHYDLGFEFVVNPTVHFLSQGYIGRKNVDLEDVKNKSWT